MKNIKTKMDFLQILEDFPPNLNESENMLIFSALHQRTHKKRRIIRS